MTTPLLHWLLRSSDQSDGGGGGGDEGPPCDHVLFCNKNSREVGPMVEGPGDVFICTQWWTSAGTSSSKKSNAHRDPTTPVFVALPKEIVEHLDRYVIGQDQAKRFLAVAVHAHYLALAADRSDQNWTNQTLQNWKNRTC